MKKIIVVGATGTIGKVTSNFLRNASCQVVTVSFSGEKTEFAVDI